MAAVEGVGDPGQGVGLDGELDALVEGVAMDLGDEGTAEGVDDVAVVVCVLKDRVLAIGVEVPTGGGDDLAGAVEGFV